MTPNELSKLPDAEINRMVAERLGYTPESFDADGGVTLWRAPSGRLVFNCDLPKWLTDLNAAWALVEERFPDAPLSVGRGGGKCRAIIVTGDKILESNTFHALAPHPARAIAVAVLLAMGGTGK